MFSLLHNSRCYTQKIAKTFFTYSITIHRNPWIVNIFIKLAPDKGSTNLIQERSLPRLVERVPRFILSAWPLRVYPSSLASPQLGFPEAMRGHTRNYGRAKGRWWELNTSPTLTVKTGATNHNYPSCRGNEEVCRRRERETGDWEERKLWLWGMRSRNMLQARGV